MDFFASYTYGNEDLIEHSTTHRPLVLQAFKWTVVAPVYGKDWLDTWKGGGVFAQSVVWCSKVGSGYY